MRSRHVLVLLAALSPLGTLAAPCVARAGEASGSRLALPLKGLGGPPPYVLAQRTITRSWGTSEESTYVEISLPDWKSEGLAFLLSGAAPGAGHAYLGESSGILFALMEIGGWVVRRHFDSRDHSLRSAARLYRGDPSDSSSAWSFERWERNSEGFDPVGIRELYERDPGEFDVRIARDPAYASGWANAAIPPHDEFRNYLDRADGMLERKRYTATALWLNHLVAGLDALRAARIHNIPLRQNLRLQVKTAWRAGSPSMRAWLERSF